MKQFCKLISFVLLIFMIIHLIIPKSFIHAEQATPAINVDLGEEADPKEFYVALDGEWLFFAEELLTPADLEAVRSDEAPQVVSIPGSFEDHMDEVNAYGTYMTTVEIPEQFVGETLAIHIPFQYSAYTFYVDQIEVVSNGTVGHDALSHEAEMAPRTGYFIPQAEEVRIAIQVSSFDHIRGGVENSIFIGEASVVAQKFNTSMVITLFINGSIFIVGLFMVLFALYRRHEHVFLIFGLFAMLISVRALFTVPFYYTVTFFDMPWIWGTRLEYILTEATSMFYVVLLWKWHESVFSKKVMYGLVVIHITLIVTTLFTKPIVFQTLFFNVFYLAIPTFFYVMYVIYKSVRNKNRYAKVNLIGIGLIFFAFFNDFALGKNWYQSVPLMQPAVGIYIVIHVFFMSKNFARSVKQTEQQNRQLLTLNHSNEKLAEKLKKEMKQKDDFLANTSHELRNPLHGIINMTQSILYKRSDELDEKTRNDLTLQLSIGHHMSRTIEDLLDLTQLKEHRIELQQEALNIRSVAVAVVDMLNIFVENKNVQINVRIPSDYPHVVADESRLIQILFNLLHNAVKYTDEGFILIDADVRDQKMYIFITDTGIGMDQKTLELIFEPYEQGDSTITSMGGGLGLGLSICKQLVELHGGHIEAKSTVGEGSVFSFSLSLVDSQVTEQLIISHEPVEVGAYPVGEMPMVMRHSMMEHVKTNTSLEYKPNIIAVDDDPVNLKVLMNILPEDQYKVNVVTSGKEALEMLEQHEYDLLISDVMMPVMSGYELTRSIREKYSISELPILLLTARSNPEDVYSGLLAGANDYVRKPVDAVELNVRVRALTELRANVDERLWMEAAWLHAQIRPHFLLNTLNAIVSLSETDTERMAKLLEELIDYLHRSFYLKNVEQEIPLEDEIALVRSYIYIEKERFGNRLHVNWELDDISDVMVPPLSIQTLVENAVNHGVLHQIEGGSVTVRIKQGEGTVDIAIIDDGVGMDQEMTERILVSQPEKEHGIGLVNTEKRLQRLYGASLQINSSLGVGTTISFKVPKRK